MGAFKGGGVGAKVDALPHPLEKSPKSVSLYEDLLAIFFSLLESLFFIWIYFGPYVGRGIFELAVSNNKMLW